MTIRRNIGFSVAVSLMLAACSTSETGMNTVQPETPKHVPEKPRARVSTISLEEFYPLHESGKALVIDARPSFIHQFGHIPGSINLPKNRCDEEIAKREAGFRSAIAAGKMIVVYCTGPTCPDALTVATHLADRGFPANVFESGWHAWQEAGLPVE